MSSSCFSYNVFNCFYVETNWVLCGSEVKCTTLDPEVQGSSCTRPLGFSWECPWARQFIAQPSTCEKQEIHGYVSCRRDLTEIMLKRRKTPFDVFNPLPDDKFKTSKLKEFADDNFKFHENGRKLSKRVENTVGKEEIAR